MSNPFIKCVLKDTVVMVTSTVLSAWCIIIGAGFLVLANPVAGISFLVAAAGFFWLAAHKLTKFLEIFFPVD